MIYLDLEKNFLEGATKNLFEPFQNNFYFDKETLRHASNQEYFFHQNPAMKFVENLNLQFTNESPQNESPYYESPQNESPYESPQNQSPQNESPQNKSTQNGSPQHTNIPKIHVRPPNERVKKYLRKNEKDKKKGSGINSLFSQKFDAYKNEFEVFSKKQELLKKELIREKYSWKNNTYKNIVFNPNSSNETFCKHLIFISRGLFYSQHCIKKPNVDLFKNKYVNLAPSSKNFYSKFKIKKMILEKKPNVLFFEFKNVLLSKQKKKETSDYEISTTSENGQIDKVIKYYSMKIFLINIFRNTINFDLFV